MWYRCSYLIDFDEIWYDDAYYPPNLMGEQKLENLKIQDIGRQFPCKVSFFSDFD